MAAKLLELKREDRSDAVHTLRQIADDLESGEREACSVGVIGMRTESGRIDVFGFGPMPLRHAFTCPVPAE